MMSDLNLRVAEALGYVITTKEVYLVNGLTGETIKQPVTVWVVFDPDGKEVEHKQFLSSKEKAIEILPDWEHDLNIAIKLLKGYFAIYAGVDSNDNQVWKTEILGNYTSKSHNLAEAICETFLKRQKADLNG